MEKPSSPKFQDVEGMRFGITTATEYLGKKGIQSYWGYRCDCGNTGSTSLPNLKLKKSCGCLHKKSLAERRTSHGETKHGRRSAEWSAWSAINGRCLRASDPAFKYYGGRGIEVCDRWRNGDGAKGGFECFLEDMGRRPSPEHSIDRFPNNDGNYEPGNCRWATQIEQQRNRSGCHWVSWNGETITLQEACDRSCLSSLAVHARLGRGWTLETALRTPSKALGGGLSGDVEIIDLGTERR
jgi:hypothetical protein